MNRCPNDIITDLEDLLIEAAQFAKEDYLVILTLVRSEVTRRLEALADEITSK